MIVRWSPIAAFELQQLHDYIFDDNPRAAAHVAAVIVEAAESLEQFPHRGRPGEVPDTRELLVQGAPVFLQYRVVGSYLEILRVIHTSRRWPPA